MWETERKWFKITWSLLLLASLVINYIQRMSDALWAHGEVVEVLEKTLLWIMLPMTVVLFVWHNVVLWGGLADVAEKYVRKGDKLYIEGKIRTTTYEDQTGIRRYRTEILAENMEMLSYRSGNNNPAQGGTK